MKTLPLYVHFDRFSTAIQQSKDVSRIAAELKIKLRKVSLNSDESKPSLSMNIPLKFRSYIF